MRNQHAVQQYGYPPNNPHYKLAHGYDQNTYPYSSYIELNRPPQPNQCPTRPHQLHNFEHLFLLNCLPVTSNLIVPLSPINAPHQLHNFEHLFLLNCLKQPALGFLQYLQHPQLQYPWTTSFTVKKIA